MGYRTRRVDEEKTAKNSLKTMKKQPNRKTTMKNEFDGSLAMGQMVVLFLFHGSLTFV